MRFLFFLAAAASLAALPSLVGCGGSSSDLPLELYDVVFAGDQFVAVGVKQHPVGESGDTTDEGVIITSPDGITWKQAAIDVDLPFWSVVQDSGRLVAVGGAWQPNGVTQRSGVAMFSDDGHAWERVDLDPDAVLSGVAHGNGRFVAVTTDQHVFTSTDGHDWALAQESQGLDLHANGIAFGNGVFVTYSGIPRIAISTDGVTWIPAEVDDAFDVWSVSFAGGAFFAGLDQPCEGTCDTPYPVARSPDGAGWIRVTQNLDHGLADVAHQDGVFVGATHSALVRSADGMAWSPGTGVEDRGWTGVAAGSPGFVAVGQGFVAHSADGSAWTEIAVDVQ